MKKLFGVVVMILCCLVMAAPAAADHDWSASAEIMIGFDSHEKLCFGFGARTVVNHIEVHYSQWHPRANDAVERALGFGYQFTTEGRGVEGNKDTYYTYTPGVAIVIGAEEYGRPILDIYNRIGLGTKLSPSADLELGVVNYLNPRYMSSEGLFGTVGLAYVNKMDNSKKDTPLVAAEGGAKGTGDTDVTDDSGNGEDDGNNGHGNDPGDDPSNPGNDDGDPNDGNNGNGNSGDERPGNGYGDDNHDHTGPPGQNKK